MTEKKKEEPKRTFWKEKCGCVLKREEVPYIYGKSNHATAVYTDRDIWTKHSYCKEHTPNVEKKSKKLLKKLQK